MRFAVRMGGDTDTIAAMAGALAGAVCGASALPKRGFPGSSTPTGSATPPAGWSGALFPGDHLGTVA